MHALLHAPRRRGRSIAAAVLSAVALIGSLLVVTPAQALNDTGTGGVFMPTTGRILDTRNNIGGYNTAMPAKTWRSIKVAGNAGVPTDGSVGAVSVVATVADITAQGQLFGRPNASEPTTMMGIYGGENKQNTSFSAVLAVNANGNIEVQTETTARLILDVQGYYTANTDGTAPGGFVPLNGKRIVDTRSGLGAAKHTLASGDRIDVQVTGTAGVPSGASGVIVNLIAVNTTDSVGYLTPYAAGATRPANSFNYAGSVATSMQAQVKLSSTGKITVYNANSTTNLVVDVQGYFTAAGKGGANFTPGAGRAYDSRTGTRTALAKNETRSIQIAGVAGVPVMGSGINSVVLTLTSLKSTAGAGYATVWADGTSKPNTTAINFDQTTIRTNTITVPLGANGKISLSNVADATNYVIDVQGWYSTPNAPKIDCGATTAGSWSTPLPTEDIECTVTAPAAANSGTQMQITVDGEDWDTVDVATSAPTASSAVLSATPGSHVIVATINEASTSFGAGFGDWASAGYTPQPDNGSVTNDAPELGVLSDTDALPSDAEINYSVYSDTSSVDPIWTAPAAEDQTAQVPVGTLVIGRSYSWSATITAESGGSASAVSRTTPRYSFTTTDGEASPDEILTYTASSGQTLGEIVDNAAETQGTASVSDALATLADAANTGTDIGFTPTEGLSTTDTAAALQAESERLAAGGAADPDSDSGSSTAPDATSSPGGSAPMAVSRAKSSWDTYVAPAKLGGGKARDGRTWIADPVVQTGVCKGRECHIVDKYTTHVVFDPNLNKSRFETTVTRNISQRSFVGGVNFEARVYRLKSEDGHLAKAGRATGRYKKVWLTLNYGLANQDVTLWASVSAKKDATNKATWKSNTAGCTSEHCDWDLK